MARRGFREAERRYKQISTPLLVAYAVLCISGTFLWAFFDVQVEVASAALAVAICVPIIAPLWAKLRQFDETDEYTQLTRLKAWARASVITVSAVFVVGFLELFDVVSDVPLFLFGPLFFLAYGVVTCVQRWSGKTV